MAVRSKEDLLREAMFVPCTSKEALHRWIKIYLGINLPDSTVCDDDVRNPPSNSNPMDLLWLMYSKALEGNDPKYQFFLAYAARDSFKTLASAIFEVLCLIHLRRDVGHLAAVESQAKNCQRYVANFFKRPFLRELLVSKNKREIEAAFYECGEHVITPVQFAALEETEKVKYKESKYFIQIMVATMSGTNSLHCSMLVFDELDLAPPRPVQEAKMVASPGKERRELPIIFMTSTRKFAIGLVQKEIDQADKTGLIIKHWNLIDITEACPPERHLPDEPKIPIYYSEDSLTAISPAEWEDLEEKKKEKFFKDEGYAGCLKNCKLFAVCRGRLATKQTSKSTLLKPIDHTIGTFSRQDLPTAKAQLLCWKPSKEGLIYPNFEKETHMLTAAQMAEKITGEKYDKNFGKKDLIKLFKEREALFYSGLDHGYTHNFAVVTGAVDGNRLFVLDVISAPELELSQKLEIMEDRLREMDPTVFPDPEDPSSNKTIGRHFSVRKFSKGKGSVVGGIEIVRFKMMPTMGKTPELYILGDDEGCLLLANRLMAYHWMLDTNEKPTNVPNEDEDDECDALRYLVMNVFKTKGKVMAPPMEEEKPPTVQTNYSQDGWAAQIIQELTGRPPPSEAITPGQAKGKKGKFSWSM